MKPTFFFDYIYYRITKTYFKWDGRTGTTAIAAITLIQVFLLIDITVYAAQFFFGRYFFSPYKEKIAFIFFIIILGLMFYNYRKYSGSYNKFKSFWKDEPESKKVFKGFMVVLSIIMPWVPLILLSIFDK